VIPVAIARAALAAAIVAAGWALLNRATATDRLRALFGRPLERPTVDAKPTPEPEQEPEPEPAADRPDPRRASKRAAKKRKIA
jgi:hypothetical protein